MTFEEIPKHRLLNQRIASSSFKQPEEVVAYMGAMQAQEYAMAKWAIALRLPGAKETEIEKAINEGKILRTHVLRPTWHFVAPQDIRWILKLSAPRVHALNAFMYRKMELDSNTFTRSNDIITKALSGGQQLTRTAINELFKQHNIIANGVQLGLLMMYAELEGLICSGARQGNQFTYALLDEVAPKAIILDDDEALATLTQRYFNSRGPATLADYATWSGLSLTTAKRGYEMVKAQFTKATLNGKEYIFQEQNLDGLEKLQTSFLMPDYDEYGIAYKDRSAVLARSKEQPNSHSFIFNRMIVLDGQIIGSWHRTLKGKELTIQTTPFKPFNKKEQQQVKKLAYQFGKFLNIDSKNIRLPNLD